MRPRPGLATTHHRAHIVNPIAALRIRKNAAPRQVRGPLPQAVHRCVGNLTAPFVRTDLQDGLELCGLGLVFEVAGRVTCRP